MPPTSSRHVRKPPSAGSKVEQVIFGNLCFKTWYDALYPEELVSKDTETLYVCSWCFRYTCDRTAYVGHMRFCQLRASPPGTQIYFDEGYSVWEVDGEDHMLFAQNLSLFAKLFLDQKSVCFDVAGFLFYLLVYVDPADSGSYHILGYFSKEKMSWDANNLACILIFPPYQHQKLGQFLMGISYHLSTWEWQRGTGSIGGPERPLSAMGEKSYIRFWEERLARYFLKNLSPDGGKKSAGPSRARRGRKTKPQEEMSLQELGEATGMLVEDVVTAIKSMEIATEEMPKKKRKRASKRDDEDAEEENSVAVIKKSSVFEWAKSRDIGLQDPINEKGFRGKWAQRNNIEPPSPEDG
ncbi:SAS complex subunit [Ophidiomyces ophidiicola]|uniref:SAS complex subunit n=1 Tax=Ophidiomyces ophidiicola TaxID=1387563 RepID=A0ACB8UYX1_9EURO|nr:SAS complex subunit [Ophidiomyces ophidiicola]KAI1924342.1 SAS complex subunit [Ophidiomyces ophidiicola]KAI1929243.1 SAS complex subunit [Ophidiomyces ophidiicola]KAI1951590.1 SAS complex subunit [Ophidiomyces ophidiicola]KAI1957698.1 SAS complex subunit [Ophidiomyces ophidiicola]